MKKSLFESLKEYSESNAYPFHMPGHKRNPAAGPMAGLYSYDITEIDGFDNLHAPEGILKEAAEYAAKLYHSEETYFSVNGSTAGILSAVSAAANTVNGSLVRDGVLQHTKKLIIARNCHKAVYHAAFLNHLEMEYIYPDRIKDFGIADGIGASQVEEKLLEIAEREKLPLDNINNLVAGIVITSPTYDGILSDVEGIVKAAHRLRIPVIVDQAHGAHFGFHPDFPESAVTQGADLVIHSVHKTLPAPTQTALIHRNGNLVSGELLRKYLGIYQSSSPSYLLMAGIDSCMRIMAQEGEKRLDVLISYRKAFEEQVRNLKKIVVYPAEYSRNKAFKKGQQEPGRLVIGVRNTSFTGKELYDALRKKYHLQMEMCAMNYVVAILSLMDEEEGFLRLANALCEIEEMLCENPDFAEGDRGEETKKEAILKSYQSKSPQVVMGISQAFTANARLLSMEEAKGEIAADFVNLYPPGIPVLVPGELIDEQVLLLLKEYLAKGFEIQGLNDRRELKTVW